MAVLFAIAKLPPSSWKRVPFAVRALALRRFYGLQDSATIRTYTRFLPTAGIGVFLAWREFKSQPFRHFSDGDLLSHFPFGYSSLIGSARLEQIPRALKTELIKDHRRAIANLHPPFCLVSVDERNEQVDLWNDALGLGKTFSMEDGENGLVVASKPLAAHLLAMREPKLSALSWASEQAFGWFLSDLTPFEGVKRLKGGSRMHLSAHAAESSTINVTADWFTKPQVESLFEGLERYRTEVLTLTEPGPFDIALSGGRDSRSSAAIFADFGGRFRTNTPPELEVIIARALVGRSPRFKSFNTDRTKAFAGDGATLWTAATPTVTSQPLEQRARNWSRRMEGLVASPAMLRGCPIPTTFPSGERQRLTVSGVAGECAKPYYWSPDMVSGVNVRNEHRFFKSLELPLAERIKTHPLTSPSALGFADRAFLPTLLEIIEARRTEGDALGIHGYRFFDYWWLSDRVGSASTVGLSSNVLMPFMTPAFISHALQAPLHDRMRTKPLTDIVDRYMPTWSGVPYYDEEQVTAPKSQLFTMRKASYLWASATKELFLDILDSSSILALIPGRDAVMTAIASADTKLATKLNKKACGLVHLHFTGELASEAARVIRSVLSNGV